MPAAFQDLPLRDELLQALEQIGYAEPTPIQAAALPLTLAGADLLGQAETGSGKTAAFGLALLQGLEVDRVVPQALVLCPTRELTDQVAAELRRLASQLPGTQILTLCGGRASSLQRQRLANGCHVVVGTPGRLGAHLERGSLDLSALRVVVIDEADRMLDMGFVDQVREVVERAPTDRQTLLFSATLPPAIRRLSQDLQREPQAITVDAAKPPEGVEQWVFECTPRTRHPKVLDLLAHYMPEQALVFCATREDCEALAGLLWNRGLAAAGLHGGMEQRDRDDTWLQFAHGSIRVLVATNVAARGLDLPALPMVIVAQVGGEAEAHVHRVGRTGRAGETGRALTLVASAGEREQLGRIEALLGQPLPEGPEIPRCPADVHFPEPAWQTLLLLSGRKDKLRKGDVLGALIKDAGLPANAIGRIDLMERSCGVAIAREHARTALDHARGGKFKGKKVRAVLLD